MRQSPQVTRSTRCRVGSDRGDTGAITEHERASHGPPVERHGPGSGVLDHMTALLAQIVVPLVVAALNAGVAPGRGRRRRGWTAGCRYGALHWSSYGALRHVRARTSRPRPTSDHPLPSRHVRTLPARPEREGGDIRREFSETALLATARWLAPGQLVRSSILLMHRWS